MTITRLAIFSQTTPTLLLPDEIKGSVQLNISEISDLNSNKNADNYLSVFVKAEGDEYGSNAIQGRYTVEGDYLIFSPYFPFEGGMTYVVRMKSTDEDDHYSYQSFQLAKKELTDKAGVVSIYPSADELPENLLRFYLYFNTPMKKGEATKHINLVDAEGNIDDKAFMEFKQELWSPDGKRLTLLFDPGRIKRGVSTNLELGPALMEGNKYQLTISESWQDVYGQELSVSTAKEFVVTRAYRQSIKVNELKIVEPRKESMDTLSIHFDRIIDHALVHSMIRIEDENKNLIAGHWKTPDDEKITQFIPEKVWKKGKYRIIMDSRLEDVAGNNLNNLLDQKTGEMKRDVKEVVRRISI